MRSLATLSLVAIFNEYNQSQVHYDVPGLFSNDSRDWWESGAILSGLLEYSFLTGDTQDDQIVREGILWQAGEPESNFAPTNQLNAFTNVAESTWGLAAMTAAEVGLANSDSREWVDHAEMVWRVQVSRWLLEEQCNCNGGLTSGFTGPGKNSKNATEKCNFFLLSAGLAKYTGELEYMQCRLNVTGVLSSMFERPMQPRFNCSESRDVVGCSSIEDNEGGLANLFTGMVTLQNLLYRSSGSFATFDESAVRHGRANETGNDSGARNSQAL
ncbi:glycoside hydrolase family 76 protein [Plenodomus tracheiphilus IPT5]|uniref:mannan endo-1,6-alpha-mannosidase n=1 Tax=Plenodomus tracheiphilus IPT5 TaxID=1408161 RepID=A0A6A7B7K1_9PLEO|nr:glycoside hydrolase family 76 protein [Plenodomus tracheiphilus IPT5]